MSAHFEIFRSNHDRWHWSLVTHSNIVVATSERGRKWAWLAYLDARRFKRQAARARTEEAEPYDPLRDVHA